MPSSSSGARPWRPSSRRRRRTSSSRTPCPPLRLAAPGRPANLGIVPVKRGIVPPVAGMHDPAQRARILHALANHELQAIELFAWALLHEQPDAAEWIGIALIGFALLSLNFTRRSPSKVCNHP